MFGYACDDTAELMPLPIFLAHRLAERLTAVRKDGELPYLRPDGKTQVTIEYDGDRAGARSTPSSLSTQHAEDISLDALEPDIEQHVIDPVLASFRHAPPHDELPLPASTPPAASSIGGPMGDAGLTGRKIIVDTYGGMARHGGGAFSGKDPSKVDRSAAYAMRWVAKNVVAAGLARRCEVQVAYAIGKAQPVGVFVETFDTGPCPTRDPEGRPEVFDLRPAAIIDDLDLLRPIYADGGLRPLRSLRPRARKAFTWERTDRAEALQRGRTALTAVVHSESPPPVTRVGGPSASVGTVTAA